MQKNSRIPYFILTLVVIALGITSRKIDGIPAFFGDILYAVMVYFGLRMFLIHISLKMTAFLSLLICFAIEFLQLYNADWMLAIRRTTFGHYVLGQGFLWSDLGYYTLGVIMAFLIDFTWINKLKSTT
ncbi:ribosomal maturation YjgA family protein [Flavobacterium nackdongense]|uniref:DUF2809 domain-containing protein n=1 Tax=Flavobacterium nackdongense TaxID=2547394 RepID=A0A4P6Y7T7_9FLAO|nr:DUF2809 domain-containing protein [Flavobacterium nackdongense]QBN17748.1 DUF2809 domain-containing protein [Flavobacterium nackdongense]